MTSMSASAFKSLLFANQKLEDLPVEEGTSTQGPLRTTWTRLANAQGLLAVGRKEEAIRSLREICASPDAHTRPRLWAWFNLRRFGVVPTVADANVVRGVVLEVRINAGTDVLAAYEDNSARYLNYSGKVIVWESNDEDITNMCQKVLLLASRVKQFSARDYVDSSQSALLRVTLLTFDGQYRIEGDPDSPMAANEGLGQIFKCGAVLMSALIARSKA